MLGIAIQITIQKKTITIQIKSHDLNKCRKSIHKYIDKHPYNYINLFNYINIYNTILLSI